MALKQNALFTCVTQSRAVRIQWFLNDTMIQPNVSIVPVNTELRLLNVSMNFNQSRISCQAELSSGDNLTSLATTLFIQGNTRVKELHRWQKQGGQGGPEFQMVICPQNFE